MSDGKDYVATVELTTKDRTVVAVPGETCEHVDPRSLEWLEQCGAIVRVTPAEDAPRG